jgi:DNA-binding HxlR family transcriptional regulator
VAQRLTTTEEYMARKERRSECPIATALDIFGDKWSLLIVRDLMFKDRRTYGELLAGGEDIATNVLAQRLEQLECAGIVERHADPSDGRRARYRLTERGIDLAPLLVEMVIWSATYERTAAPPELVEEMRRNRRAFISKVRKRWASEKTNE